MVLDWWVYVWFVTGLFANWRIMLLFVVSLWGCSLALCFGCYLVVYIWMVSAARFWFGVYFVCFCEFRFFCDCLCLEVLLCGLYL